MGRFPACGGADRAPRASPCGSGGFPPSQPSPSSPADLATTTNPQGSCLCAANSQLSPCRAATEFTAVTAAGCRCAPPPESPRPRPTHETERQWPVGPSLALPRSIPVASSPESSSPRRPAAPRGHIAKQRIFLRVFLQRVTQIVFVMWLILLSCV
jgi:hypothetical protein